MIHEGIEESERLASMQQSDSDEDEALRRAIEMSLQEENDRHKKLASIKEQNAKKPNVVPVTAHVPEPDLRAVITNGPVPCKNKGEKQFDFPAKVIIRKTEIKCKEAQKNTFDFPKMDVL